MISDGEDNLSHVTRDYAASEALRAGTVIFTLNTNDSGMTGAGERVLENLARQTGGESFSGISKKNVPTVFASIRELIDGMYYLTSAPPDASKNTVHEIEVKRVSKEKFEVSYAREYFWNP